MLDFWAHVGGAVSRRIVITDETSGESKSLARSLSEVWGSSSASGGVHKNEIAYAILGATSSI
jgi:hypothetical protein